MLRATLLLSVCLLPTSSRNAEAHLERELEGWTLEVDRSLLDGEHAALGARGLKLLGAELLEIATVLPADRVAELRRVRIRVDRAHALESLQYHPDRDWLVEHGHDPTLVKRVHVPRLARLVDLLEKNWQPWVLLHELAHAWHDQTLGFDHPGVRAAHERAEESGLYDSVLHVRGKDRRHYALTDPKEFFAEMSEAYFGTNDFFPFVRAELERADPETHALLEELWGSLPD